MSNLRAKTTDTAANILLDTERGRGVFLEAVPEFKSGAWQLLWYEITALQHHHSKHIVSTRVYYRDEQSRRAGMADIIASVFHDGQGAKVMNALRQLWGAGFRPPSRYRVPRPYGYSEELGILLQAAAPGMAWAGFLQGAQCSLARSSARAAAWLTRLQQIPVHREADASLDYGSAAESHGKELARAFPQYATRLESLVERMVPRLRADGIPPVYSHGDYHPKNVFLSPGLTTVIDFDSFGLREAAFDVGCSIGQLLNMSFCRTGGFSAGADAALAFWHRYGRGGQAPWPRVAAHVARTLLQVLHYTLCALAADRIELLALSTALMEDWLESDGPGILDRLSLHSASTVPA